MELKIIGSGCPSCAALHEKVKRIVEENSVSAKIEYVKNVEELIALGVMSSPALTIDGEVAFSGHVSDSELREMILEAAKKRK